MIIHPDTGRKEKSRTDAIDTVLSRWGIEAPGPRPTVDHLRKLHRAWLANVPFENVTKVIRAATAGGDSRRRSSREFWSDHLRWGSGGTCFDVTAAFRILLEHAGFAPDVIFCRPPERRGRSHVALLVTLTKRTFLVDAGYALPIPLPLPGRGGATRRRTPYYDIEVRSGPGNEFLVFTVDDRGSRFRYTFDTKPATTGEFRAAWDRTFEPGAPYMKRLALGKFRRGVRYIYKGPSSLFILTRGEQTLLRVPAQDTGRLSLIFGLPETLLKRGMSVLERRI